MAREDERASQREHEAMGWGRQGFQCRKLRYRARPWAALFSGWNWVAKMLSRAMALVKLLPFIQSKFMPLVKKVLPPSSPILYWGALLT